MAIGLFRAISWSCVIGAIGTAALGQGLLHANSCEELSRMKLKDTAISQARIIHAGELNLPPGVIPNRTTQSVQSFADLPAFCRIEATIRPSTDSEIRIEVWMPSSGWNGRFLGLGNGGWAGTISYPYMADVLAKGYATASTDTGHIGTVFDANFALGHPEKLVDYGYRAIHLMTIDAKALIASFYGTAAHYSYWSGCSTGGRQGLMEAQRFPNDYDGIIAGDPPNFFTHLMFAYIWPEVVSSADKANSIPSEKIALVQQAATKACDAFDGVIDGVINDPRSCHFDPKEIQCKGGDSSDCLTAAQVKAVRKLYLGPQNSRTGEQIFPSLEPGSSPDPAIWPIEVNIAASFFKNVLFPNQNWNVTTLDFDSDVERADRKFGGILNAVDPNLKPFKQHGGKLILYQGWYDPFIAPANAVAYYESVVTAMGGEEKTEEFARLFMIPGMGHCGGGPGASTFDELGALDRWVVDGIAPDRILASHLTNGAVDMTRPLCPYPKAAQWMGTGTTADAVNFFCVDHK